jgi:hypothetical protein
MADRNFVSEPIIVHKQWMIHGDIRRALFKLTHGITARGHYIAEQLVGLSYRSFGVVNELCLNLAPGCDIDLPVAWRERPDGETLDAFFSLLEPGFPLPSAPAFLDGAGIFRPESSAQSFCFAPL